MVNIPELKPLDNYIHLWRTTHCKPRKDFTYWDLKKAEEILLSLFHNGNAVFSSDKNFAKFLKEKCNLPVREVLPREYEITLNLNR